MRPEEAQYVLYRLKTQSDFQNGKPNEYPSARIRADMKKSGFEDPPSETEIDNFIGWKKEELSRRILGLIGQGVSISDVRTWCEHSLDCPLPIESLSQVTADGILSRFNYFNHVICNIARQRQLDVLIQHRREKGTNLDVNSVIMELENSGLYRMQDEITRTTFYSEGDLLRILMEEEEDAIRNINDQIHEGMSRKEILKQCLDLGCFIFKENELKQIIDENILKYRISKIASRIRGMQASEVWGFINVVEGYQLYRITGETAETAAEKAGIDVSVIHLLREYENGVKSDLGDHLYHLSQLGIGELRQLSKLLRAFLAWRGVFHFMKKDSKPGSPADLMLSIIDSFSGENGVDSGLFRCFLY